MFENQPMNAAMIFAGARAKSCRVLCALAMAAFCVVVSPVPGNAQFDFLFGLGKPAQPAAPAQPQGTPAHKSQTSKAKPSKPKPKKAVAATPAPDAKGNTPAPAAEGPPPPYDPEMLRLAEILGALTYLDDLCASKPSGDWRAKMQTLLEAEAKTTARKERLAGSYNRGFHDYERSYRVCTQNAQAVISRFLAEGGKIAHDVVNRYGSS
jgi:uncharacterized protein (TIGR02301 family)